VNDRPAQLEQIEPTSEMVEAGAEIIFEEASELASGWATSSDVAKRVWRAMYSQLRSSDPNSL